MVYSTSATVRAKAFGIAATSEAAQAFVTRFIMQTVLDVLEQQGRSALLSDAIISTILGQITVQVRYEPLECKDVVVNQPPATKFGAMGVEPHCIIVGSTVTSVCTGIGAADDCDISVGAKITSIPSAHSSISTTNTIMVNWSREMWQNIVNRAIRMLALGPFESHFISAFATVS
ncbi:hypothetical protein KIN20_011551 [Parelaphostrongylus tenuis]|uniref:Uncharacterized protein n=1 Tax=Parelaphostrongylus tenuis TaxID=148309 RepID=A0AAD5M9K5_PARTN|nr:hypothetical protein KIN20_011551 [Parelaphostrongylus tenuis]